MTVLRAVVGALALGLALGLATPSPSLAQRADPTQPFPKASPVITRFQDDPRMARLEGYLQALADRPTDWGDYPVLVGFFAATFQRHPDWIDKLLPTRFDAKTADLVSAALQLSGQPAPAATLRARLSAAGHDAKLSAELARLPARLEDLKIAFPTHLDIMWGAFFATGDTRYVRPILEFFAGIANQSDAVALDITRVTVAMSSGPKDDLQQVKSRHDQSTLLRIIYASTAELALIANARNFPAVKRTLADYVAANGGKPAAKSLSAFLKHI
jgi:hypothetical protein